MQEDHGGRVVQALRDRYRDYVKLRPASPFAVRGPDGRAHVIGSGEPSFTVTATDPRGLGALRSLDQYAIAVAYLDGWLDISGDMLRALSMRDMFHDRHPLGYLSRFARPLLTGQTNSDQRFISQHYDIDSDFFLLFMDTRHRCYSHAVFARDDEPLEDAMTRKMDIATQALGVGPGDHVLEIGGGWGAFVEYAGKRDIKVTTLTISKESERFLNALVARERLPVSVVREHVFEYRPGQQYDAIVNMGVTEHLPNYRATLAAYERLLRPGGRVYLDAVAMQAKHRVSTFMSRYIYPGNASPLVLHSYLAAVARSRFELVSAANDRRHYYLTCKAWAERLDASREEIVRRWGEQLYRRFRLYLWGSAAGFRSGRVQAYRWVLDLPSA